MAAHGGGAWKVAYADFITAMMAFFLVMWLVGQDQKIRRSVADYFSDPLGSTTSSATKKTSRTGALADHINTGSIPMEEHVALGQGKLSFSADRQRTPGTTAVYNWIHQDSKAGNYWRKQVANARETARWSKEVKKDDADPHKVATRLLSQQMQAEFLREVPPHLDRIQRDLLLQAIREVNWGQLAQELLDQ